MGTFGAGAFSSDGAMDFVDQLAERPPERRAAALEHVFQLVKEEPHLLWRKFFPDEVVAAAAVVAASLPGGEQFNTDLEVSADDGTAPNVGLPEPAPKLAKAALEALLFVASPGGPWHQGWTNEADAAEARGTIDVLTQVLAEAQRV